MVDTLVPNNPYVGPRSIKTGEAFFGREREIRSLSALLSAERIVLLHSPSGAGKSSLIQAGLAPRLAERFSVFPLIRVNLEPPEEVRRVPGTNRYVLSTLLSLEEGLPPEKRRPLNELATQTLEAYLEQRALPNDALENCLMLFDQFEEVLTVSPSDGPAKQQFFEQLGEALQNRRRWALFAIREDYMGGLAPYVRAIPNRLNVTFRLGLLGPEAAKVAIQQPAKDRQVEFTDEAAHKLVDDLRRIQVQQPDGSFVSEQGPEIEPVQLQVVCFNLWQSHAADDKLIDEHDLQRVGSVDQALASYYAKAVQIVAGNAKLEERLLRQWFDEHLITPEGIRSQVLKGAESTEGLPNIVLRLLENTHLIRGETRAGKTWYELSHDRLVQPVRQENTAWFEKNLSLLQRQSVLWNQRGRREGLLLRGNELIGAEKEAKTFQLTPDEQEFLAASRKLLGQQRFRRTAVLGLISFSIVTLGLLVFALVQLNTSRAQSLGFQAQSAFVESKYNTAFLYAYQSNLIHKNDAADLVLGQIPYKNFAGGKQLNGHTDSVTSVAWSADGKLASGSSDDTIIIWDLKAGKIAQKLLGHTSTVTSVAWSADGQLASASDDGTVILWDLKTGRPSQTLPGNGNQPQCVAWSANGQLASSYLNGIIIIWDLKTGQPAQTLRADVSNIAWSADGQLASSSSDGTVILWNLQTGQPSKTLNGYDVAWSLKGQLTSVADDRIIIWDIKTGQPAQTLQGLNGYLGSIAWSAGGQLASVANDGIIIWDLQTGQPAQTLKGHTEKVNSIAWSADGSLASGSDDGTVIIWDLKAGQPAQTMETHTRGVRSIDYSTDGRLASGSNDGMVIIWDLNTGQPLQTMKTKRRQSIYSVAWSKDGQLASSSDDLDNGTVTIWDLKTGQPAQTLIQSRGNSVYALAWSQDGRLASGSLDGSVIVWDLKTGKPAQTLTVKGYTDYVYDLAWSTDGRLASATGDNAVIIWNLKTGQPDQFLKGTSTRFYSVAWSADGQLASASQSNNNVIIWDLQTSRPVQTLKGHQEIVWKVAWSPDGKLASGSYDGTVIIWDLKKGQPAQILKAHTMDVSSVVWLADGRLASGSSDGTIEITRADLTGGNLCDKIIRNMTIQEWLKYQGVFYVYQPACANLYDPSAGLASFNVFIYGPTILLITWKGRAILFVLLLILSGIVFFIARAFYKFAPRAWRKLRSRRSAA